MFSGSGGGRRARELDTFNCRFCLFVIRRGPCGVDYLYRRLFRCCSDLGELGGCLTTVLNREWRVRGALLGSRFLSYLTVTDP